MMFENSEPGTLGAELNDLSLDKAKLLLQEAMIDLHGPMSKWSKFELEMYERLCGQLEEKKINKKKET